MGGRWNGGGVGATGVRHTRRAPRHALFRAAMRALRAGRPLAHRPTPGATAPKRCCGVARAGAKDADAVSAPPAPPPAKASVFLSDLLTFESDGGAPVPASEPAPADLEARAGTALSGARAALADARARAPVSAARAGGKASFTYASGKGGSGAAGAPHAGAAAPAWAQSAPAAPEKAAELEPQAEAAAAVIPPRPFADPPRAPGELSLPSQAAADAAAASAATLPPPQSASDLTSAAAPPARGATAGAVSTAAAALTDGKGTLADGSTYERDSGEERGPGGLWHRWTRVAGASADGLTTWTETWWETSDWAGRKELGAEKAGTRADGAAWREAWREAVGYDGGEATVVRTAHKWARAADGVGEEWEERWDESYWAGGRATKSADKWARRPGDEWHERWGEEYAGNGDGCVKWTDKWAERDAPGGGKDRWGDKWDERFAGGVGGKSGETWSAAADGSEYRRWWGEDHAGEGWVRKHGHSTAGDAWDATEQSGTYYNPVPHFTYAMALAHSPTLTGLGTLPRGGGGGGGGGGSGGDLDDGVAGL